MAGLTMREMARLLKHVLPDEHDRPVVMLMPDRKTTVPLGGVRLLPDRTCWALTPAESVPMPAPPTEPAPDAVVPREALDIALAFARPYMADGWTLKGEWEEAFARIVKLVPSLTKEADQTRAILLDALRHAASRAPGREECRANAAARAQDAVVESGDALIDMARKWRRADRAGAVTSTLHRALAELVDSYERALAASRAPGGRA